MAYNKKPTTKHHVNPYLFLLLKRLIEMQAVIHEAIESGKNGGQVSVTGKTKKPIVSNIYPPITVVVKYVFDQEGIPDQVENLAEFVRKAWSKLDFKYETWRLTEIVKLTKLLTDFRSWEDFAHFEEGTDGEKIGRALVNKPYSDVSYGQKVMLGMMVEARVTNIYIRRFVERLYYKVYNYREPFTRAGYLLSGKNHLLPNEIPKGLKPIFQMPEYQSIVNMVEHDLAIRKKVKEEQLRKEKARREETQYRYWKHHGWKNPPLL